MRARHTQRDTRDTARICRARHGATRGLDSDVKPALTRGFQQRDMSRDVSYPGVARHGGSP